MPIIYKPEEPGRCSCSERDNYLSEPVGSVYECPNQSCKRRWVLTYDSMSGMELWHPYEESKVVYKWKDGYKVERK